MGFKSFVILAGVTVLAVVGAAYSLQQREQRLGLPSVPAVLFPDLLDRVNEVARVEVVSPAESFTIAKRDDDTWGMEEKRNYPVLFETVKQAAIGIAGMRPLEAKTANPDRHDKLRVLDPRADGEAKGKGTLVRLLDGEGGEVAAVIIGKTRSISTAEREGWYYVRRPEQPRTWLVAARIEANEKALRWLDATMVRIARSRIRAAATRQADGATVEISRPDTATTDFTIDNVPEGMKPIHKTVANDLGSALGYIAFDDVKGVEEIDFSGASSARFETFDGLVLDIDIVERDGKKWARFKARHAPDLARLDAVEDAQKKQMKSADEVAEEAELINRRYGVWAYNLPNYKADDLTKPMKKMVMKADDGG